MDEDKRIEAAADKYMNSEELHYFQDPCDLDVRDAFIAGVKWMMNNIKNEPWNDVVEMFIQNQWQKIERDKDGFAIDTTLAEVLIMEDSGEVYINDDDDYVHNAHCRYYMPIPSLNM